MVDQDRVPSEASCSSWRSRSICSLNCAGRSRSSLNEARSLSPISRTIARLCEEPISTELRIRVLRQANAGRDRRLWLSCASACSITSIAPRIHAIRSKGFWFTGRTRCIKQFLFLRYFVHRPFGREFTISQGHSRQSGGTARSVQYRSCGENGSAIAMS